MPPLPCGGVAPRTMASTPRRREDAGDLLARDRSGRVVAGARQEDAERPGDEAVRRGPEAARRERFLSESSFCPRRPGFTAPTCSWLRWSPACAAADGRPRS